MAGQEEATADADQATPDRDANCRSRPAPPIGAEMPLLGSLPALVDALLGDIACEQWVHRVLLVVEPGIAPAFE
jgi:hypothetical protein